MSDCQMCSNQFICSLTRVLIFTGLRVFSHTHNLSLIDPTQPPPMINTRTEYFLMN
jgi:hypothetical protein